MTSCSGLSGNSWAATEKIETVIVGGGQAGLAVSYCLAQQGRDHVVLEQTGACGDAWRHHRWDSFTLNTPNWQTRLPGDAYQGDAPDAFMARAEIVTYLDAYAQRFQLPVRNQTRIIEIERYSRGENFIVRDSRGKSVCARNVVIATGLYQRPNIPSFSSDLPPEVSQIHSDAYRNPEALPSGATLVVGSAQSGAQIAEELYQSGRRVYLCVGRAGRVPRRYRGKDSNWWSDRMGLYDQTVDKLPSPKAKFFGKPMISGTKGGHTLNLHQFARDGVTLLGHLQGINGHKLVLAPDLMENLAKADQFEADFVKAVDSYIARTNLDSPEEQLPTLRDGFDVDVLAELDLTSAGITNVIWATSYRFDFSLVKLPVLDSDGYPVQQRGVTASPGLYFVGLPWIYNAKSGLLYGVEQDATYVATQILTDTRAFEDANILHSPADAWLSHELSCA
jgi:putative flavoprotein involved in K+ transport